MPADLLQSVMSMSDKNRIFLRDRPKQKSKCFRGLRHVVRWTASLRWRRLSWLVVTGYVLTAVPTASLEAVPAHEHIARLNHAGLKARSHCTAFLNRAGGIVTAAHCLPDVPDDIVHVLLSYERGKTAQHLKAPGKAYRRIPQRDLAVLCPDRASSSGLEFESSPPTRGTKVLVRGYGVPKVHVLQQKQCVLSKLFSGKFAELNCSLPAGTSGGPVIDAQSEKVIGVVSSSGKNRSLIALVDPGILQSLCAN